MKKWKRMQTALIESFEDTVRDIAGDAQYDSPGKASAKYCTYTGMDLLTGNFKMNCMIIIKQNVCIMY